MTMMARTVSLLPFCIVLSGCAFPFTLPAFGRPAELGNPSFVTYAQSQRRLEMGAKLRGLTPYVSSADVQATSVAETEAAPSAPAENAPPPAGSASMTLESTSDPIVRGAAELPPAPVPPCNDGSPQRLWVMEPGSDLADGLRQWTADAGLAAFYTDTSGWRFPMGKAGVHFNGCFEGAVTTALDLFARHSVRPKVQVDRDGYVYLSVFVGAS
jgi:hypothetical protein